jgi:hypothetical protein
MKHFFTLLYIICNIAVAQTLTVPLPSGCVPTLSGNTIVCNGTPTPPVPPTPPTPPGPISCPGFPTTVINMTYTNPFSVAYSNQFGGFKKDGALVVVFKTPAQPSPPPTKGKGNWGTVEFTGSPAVRTGSLSLTPCDFTKGLEGGISTAFVTQEPTVYFTFGYNKPGTVQLQPNTTYYLNEINMFNGINTCSNATCDVKVTLTAN